MTLANILRQKLSETPARDERHDLAVSDPVGGWTVYLTAERRDAWTTVAWELSLRRGSSAGEVAAWAERIAQRTSGLLEPLRVVEVDALHRKALMRSLPPTEHDGKISYYELVLEETCSALLRRYEGAHASGKRAQIAMVLTNEVLTKLAGDLTVDESK